MTRAQHILDCFFFAAFAACMVAVYVMISGGMLQ